MPRPAIDLTEAGFTVTGTGRGTPDTVAFDQVQRVTAWKLDRLTTDLVCVEIVSGEAPGSLARTLTEDIPGFEALMRRLESLPGFDADWRAKVLLPPFRDCRTTIFDATC